MRPWIIRDNDCVANPGHALRADRGPASRRRACVRRHVYGTSGRQQKKRRQPVHTTAVEESAVRLFLASALGALVIGQVPACTHVQPRVGSNESLPRPGAGLESGTVPTLAAELPAAIRIRNQLTGEYAMDSSVCPLIAVDRDGVLYQGGGRYVASSVADAGRAAPYYLCDHGSPWQIAALGESLNSLGTADYESPHTESPRCLVSTRGTSSRGTNTNRLGQRDPNHENHGRIARSRRGGRARGCAILFGPLNPRVVRSPGQPSLRQDVDGRRRRGAGRAGAR